MKQAEHKDILSYDAEKKHIMENNYLWAEDALADHHYDKVKIMDSFELPELSALVLTYTVYMTKRVAVVIDKALAWEKQTDIVSAKEIMLLYLRYSAVRNIPEGVDNLKKSDIDFLRKIGIPEEEIMIISNAMKKWYTRYLRTAANLRGFLQRKPKTSWETRVSCIV